MTALTTEERMRPSATVAGRARGELEGGTPVETDELPELSFVHPLPGFPGLRRYVLVRLDGDTDGADGADGAASETEPADAADGDVAVLYELRSVEQPELTFLVGVPRAFFPEYTIELDDQSCDDLGLHEPADALVLVILSAGADPSATTANLLAPVVINASTRAAAQVILTGSEWPVRALIA
jgi:flagellar assembly factor FliW